MRREVWFKEDLGQVLLAVGEANRSACGAMLEPRLAGEREEAINLAQAYQAGFEAALHSLALAFGLLDVAGSLPRSWVGAVDVEAGEVWSRADGRWLIVDG